LSIAVSQIQIVLVKPLNGLVGFASCIIDNQFYVGNIAIYTSPSSQDGFRLVFPQKKLSSGQVIDCFHPINKDAERQVTLAIVKRYIELMDNFDHVEIV
jgi:DNA-binding cell septation regulator SpoVG